MRLVFLTVPRFCLTHTLKAYHHRCQSRKAKSPFRVMTKWETLLTHVWVIAMYKRPEENKGTPRRVTFLPPSQPDSDSESQDNRDQTKTDISNRALTRSACASVPIRRITSGPLENPSINIQHFYTWRDLTWGLQGLSLPHTLFL